MIILDDYVYLSRGPTSDEIDLALSALHPDWLPFRQDVVGIRSTAGDVFRFASYGGPDYALSSAVLLVTVGTNLHWQLPSDGDLFGRAVQAGKTLHPMYAAYYTDEQVRASYPEIGNAATYALFRYLAKDLLRLDAWCAAYQALFGEVYPLRQ